jgi:hypothetical protein
LTQEVRGVQLILEEIYTKGGSVPRRLSYSGVIAFSACLLLDGGHAHAQIIDLPKIFGVSHAVDEGVDRFNDAVERARSAAFALEYQTNTDVKTRLDQIQEITDHTTDRVEKLEAKTSADIERILKEETARLVDLETKTMVDIDTEIRKVECSANLIVNQSIPDLLGSVGKLIGANQIEITAPVLYEGETQPFFCGNDKCKMTKTFPITTPFSSTYRDIRTYLLDRLDSARDDTPRYTLVVTYSVLAQFAKRTSCFFPGTEKDYVDDYEYYVNKAKQWDIVPETRR